MENRGGDPFCLMLHVCSQPLHFCVILNLTLNLELLVAFQMILYLNDWYSNLHVLLFLHCKSHVIIICVLSVSGGTSWPPARVNPIHTCKCWQKVSENVWLDVAEDQECVNKWRRVNPKQFWWCCSSTEWFVSYTEIQAMLCCRSTARECNLPASRATPALPVTTYTKKAALL